MPLPNLSGNPADYTSDQITIGLVGGGDANPSVAPGLSFKSSATLGYALYLGRAGAVLAAPTVALMGINIGSTASTAAIALFGQSFVSCTTILFTTGGTAGTGALRVAYPDGVTLGWIPILPSGAVTGAVRG